MSNLRLSLDVMNTKKVRDFNRAKFEISETNKRFKKTKVFERVNSLNRVLQNEDNFDINDSGIGFIALPKNMIERSSSQIIPQAKISGKQSNQKFSSIYDQTETQATSVSKISPTKSITLRNSLQNIRSSAAILGSQSKNLVSPMIHDVEERINRAKSPSEINIQ